ncbi:sulfotransferase family 2 domain-containing protein [Paracoccus sp. S1E-3]|uniref:sulfotransferase family 2 domain-containing protein n=1 Tax=Paracoccus sp. S1E-3 TaxID=2756130 RepID=UPI0015EE7CFC|nr:sulfotransferase family 2 domain-containing protein [Paracoccus sp. S1E-3]MBA4490078.1 hypothetical protein [Paracoccus sp. S1E-3]
MLIFWDQRLVFLATPKAGSTAVEVALEPLASLAVQRPPEMKHADAARFHRHIHPWLSEMTADHFTTVALMREPVEWLRSWYRFYLRDEQDSETPDNSRFEDFVRLYLAHPESVTQGIGTQSAFLTGGDAPVDRIFRYEDMAAFTHFLDEWLDCAINLPRINVPPSADVTLSSATEAELRLALAPDFRLYATLS